MIRKWAFEPNSMKMTLPKNTAPIHVGHQRTVTVWTTDVNPYGDTSAYEVQIFGTGDTPPYYARHIGTVQMPTGYVWHVFHMGVV